MDWVTFQAGIEDRLLVNPVAINEEEIDKCVKEMTSAI
jgi:hypothetical protein